MRLVATTMAFLVDMTAVYADLMRRVVSAGEFSEWLHRFLPDIPEGVAPADWLEPAVVTDASDGKLAHLDGLPMHDSALENGMLWGCEELLN